MPKTLYREIAIQLTAGGWNLDRRRGRGSHSIFIKREAKRPIVLSWNIKDHNLGRSILRQAGCDLI